MLASAMRVCFAHALLRIIPVFMWVHVQADAAIPQCSVSSSPAVALASREPAVCGPLNVCFDNGGRRDTFLAACRTNVSQCVASSPAGLSYHTAGAKEPQCVAFSQAQDCADGQYNVTAVASPSSGPRCAVSAPAPVTVDRRPPELLSWALVTNPESAGTTLHMQLTFNEPLSHISRASWILYNGNVVYFTIVDTTILLGVHKHEQERGAILHLPAGSIVDANGNPSVVPTQLALAPPALSPLAAGVNGAAALTALMGTAAPLRIVRSVLHSQFLAWTSALAVPALPPLYRAMVRTLQCATTPQLKH